MLTLFLAMSLVEIFRIVLVLALFGFLVHLVLTHVPMAGPVKQIIVVVLVLLLILWVLDRFGGSLNL